MQEQIPDILRQTIGNENTDFVIRTKRGTSIKGAAFLIILGSLWTLINLLIFISFIIQITSQTDMGLSVSSVLSANQHVSLDSSLADKIKSGIGIGLFLVIGLVLLGLGINAFFAKGAWFVATPSRLISCRKNKIRSVDWREIKGGVDVSGDNDKGDVLIGLSSAFKNQWPILSGGNFFYMIGIQDALKIADICRKRIEENNK